MPINSDTLWIWIVMQIKTQLWAQTSEIFLFDLKIPTGLVLLLFYCQPFHWLPHSVVSPEDTSKKTALLFAQDHMNFFANLAWNVQHPIKRAVVPQDNFRNISSDVRDSERFLTIWGSFDRLTQPEISFSVSRFTVLILRIKGCLVTISPATQRGGT